MPCLWLSAGNGIGCQEGRFTIKYIYVEGINKQAVFKQEILLFGIKALYF
jgi:hypothetical protein